MSLRCIILKISIGIFFFPSLSFAQTLSFDTLQFTRHLKQNHLFIEQASFNKNLQQIHANNPIIIDSLKLDLALIYYQLHLPDSCKSALLSISNNCCYSPHLNHQYLSMLLVNKEYSIAQTVIDKSPFMDTSYNLYRKSTELSLRILKRTLTEKDTSTFAIPAPLLDIKNRYFSPPHYSPALAGVYSALIPGLGKLYIGYKNQALTAFISNTLLAAQATESYLKSGVKSPRFIITATVFSIFYTGNIIGSIVATKKKKKDYYNELDYEILNYYSADINKLVK
jgi:hypothetical protein